MNKDFDLIKHQNLFGNFMEQDEFTRFFKNHFDSIVSYHATNLSRIELESVRRYGIKKSSVNLLKDKAIHRFLMSLDENELKIQIEDFINDYFEVHAVNFINEINFGLVEEELLTESYQYLLFGSEGLLPLASELKSKFNINFRKRLADSGNPYIIKARIPISIMNNMWIEGIYDYLFKGAIEASLVINSDVGPECLIKIDLQDRPTDKYNFLHM